MNEGEKNTADKYKGKVTTIQKCFVRLDVAVRAHQELNDTENSANLNQNDCNAQNNKQGTEIAVFAVIENWTNINQQGEYCEYSKDADLYK
mmetsp:Transcript_12307/g.22037  ORF Transcript_12307/g.22037 Transcript_12307/m.22037 type:complete len:91 (-) Transcript_12307:634-906(-)